MTIIEDIIDKAKSQENMVGVKCIVLHWIAGPKQTAKQVRNFFNQPSTVGNAHYVVGLDGEVIHCVPDNKAAYHAGSTQPDPASKKIYTDEARMRFGVNSKGDCLWPNSRSIGIEMCHTDWNGNMTEATLNSVADLVASLLKKYKLTIEDVTTHHNLVGWKDCPKLWTDHPEMFEEFKTKYIKPRLA